MERGIIMKKMGGLKMSNKTISNFMTFIQNSPSCFHAVEELRKEFHKEGFVQLFESKQWKLEKGGKYYVIRNGSSIISFTIGEEIQEEYSFQICASHSDSPTYKLKENAFLDVRGKYTQLNTEGYGGMIASTWMDRPLSIAGRALVKTDAGCVVKLVDFKKDMVLIPNVAIHMNREINSGYKYNAQVDMLPLYGGTNKEKETFLDVLAKELDVDAKDILGNDLYLYNRNHPSIWGSEEDYISAPKLDDLECAYTTMLGFLHSKNPKNINVYACFDNEEVGSGTKQGADSTLLFDVLTRINRCLGYSEEQLRCAFANSFMLSADNAHALHPNHPEKSDANHAVYMNEGIVVKFNANQKYTTDALSKGLFQAICNRVEVPLQYFANRSDMQGGSTLGNISTAHVSIHTVDIGLAQLAMHSSYETAGCKDIDYMIKAVQEFYSSYIREDDQHRVNLYR